MRATRALFLCGLSLAWILLAFLTTFWRTKESTDAERATNDKDISVEIEAPYNESFFMPHSPLARSWSISDTTDSILKVDSSEPLTYSLPVVPSSTSDLPEFGIGNYQDINASSSGSHVTSHRPSIHIITYASHAGKDDRFCRTIESAIRNEIDLVVLGWGQRWKGLPQKLEAALTYSKTLPKEDVIMFVDAFDVLFIDSAERILDTYLQVKAPKLLFAAECGCWPVKISCFTRYPRSPTTYRYLNSGTWMGRVEDSIDMLTKLMKRAGKGELAFIANDQRLCSDMYESGGSKIRLDHYAAIFQSMHATLGPPLPYCNPIEDLVLEKVGVGRGTSSNNGSRALFRNRRTGTRPLVFHFNGGGKEHHREIEKNIWYRQQAKIGLHSVVDKVIRTVSNGIVGWDRSIKFREMCPGYNP